MASQPKAHDNEEGLEELDLDDAAVISHQSELHLPARRQAVQVDEPSVVVADDPEPNIHESGPRQATTRRSRRALEPTLMIRDRRAASELRDEMERRVRELKQQQLRSTLMWVAAGLVAFGLGGLLALVVAKRQASARIETDARMEANPVRQLDPARPAPGDVRASEEPRTIDLDEEQ